MTTRYSSQFTTIHRNSSQFTAIAKPFEKIISVNIFVKFVLCEYVKSQRTQTEVKMSRKDKYKRGHKPDNSTS